MAASPSGSKAAALAKEACSEIGREGKDACALAAASGKKVCTRAGKATGNACAALALAGVACVKASTTGGKACLGAAGSGGKACTLAASQGGKACGKAADALKADVAKLAGKLRTWWLSIAPPAGGAGSSAGGAHASGWSEADIQSAFARFDTNRSGKLDFRELRPALTRLGADVQADEAIAVLQAYDANGNGLMEIDEFRRLVHQMQPAATAARSSAQPQQ